MNKKTPQKLYIGNQHRKFSSTNILFVNENEDILNRFNNLLSNLQSTMNETMRYRDNSLVQERKNVDKKMDESNEDVWNNIADVINTYFPNNSASKAKEQQDQHLRVVNLFNEKINNLDKNDPNYKQELFNLENCLKKLKYNFIDKHVDIVKTEFNNATAKGNVHPEKKSGIIEILDNCKRKRASLLKDHEELVARERNNFTTLANTTESNSSSYTANCPLEESEQRSLYLDIFRDLMPYSDFFIYNSSLLLFIIFIAFIMVLIVSKFNGINTINKFKNNLINKLKYYIN